MADYCYQCTADEIAPEYAERNDFVHEGAPYWALCEGCGIHLFRYNGKRACGRGPELPAYPEACPMCIEREYA